MTLVPNIEALRRAIAWLAEQHEREWSAQLIEEACQRFDVAPADEEFLLGELEKRKQQR
ncbi:MAG TPA: hypothetical protein VMN56_16500 [Casimicrobiaceae bacterium]|nr:hypothetical protein [Casimicrobiaceae bacterium]